MGRSRGGQGVRHPLKITKIKGFLAILVSGSPEKSQSYQASIHCWAIIGTPAKRRAFRWLANEGPLIVVIDPSPSEKNVVKVRPL